MFRSYFYLLPLPVVIFSVLTYSSPDSAVLLSKTRGAILGLSSLLFTNTACQLTTVRSNVPASHVALQSYSYCGGYLNVTAFVANTHYNKVVTLSYSNAQNVSTPLTSVALGYRSSILDTDYEYWSGYFPVYIDGITELLRLDFQDIDSGQTYSQPLAINVVPSGAPAPKYIPSVPAPYASPTGLADDITDWLAEVETSQAATAKALMFLNINPDVPGASSGTVTAARSGPSYPAKDPDYEYNWVRDSALTMDVVQTLYAASTSSQVTSLYETILFEYAAARSREQTNRDAIAGLGEPKFYLNQTAFTGSWGRPQNDGPATAAITLMEFANEYIARGGSPSKVKTQLYGSQLDGDNAATSAPGPILKDLLFVVNNWPSPSFDLWEEVSSTHFYTRMVQRKALLMGVQFAESMSDDANANLFATAATNLTSSLGKFWDPNRQLILYEYGPILRGKSSYKDIAVILGVIHGYASDGVYSFTNDQVLITALQISTSFLSIYPIADTTRDSADQLLGIPVGRYPEDIYTGTGTEENGGNPWFLCTAAMAELLYRATSEYRTAGSINVTSTSLPFFDYYAPSAKVAAGKTYQTSSAQFMSVIAGLGGWADAYVRRIKYHTPAGGHLPEEFNRNTGFVQGATDLTWSYASLLTAAFARAQVVGNEGYITALANMDTNVHT
ncbi:hypothetical protein MBLNU457_4067t1 [Dothideomycetes sp. NU457]